MRSRSVSVPAKTGGAPLRTALGPWMCGWCGSLIRCVAAYRAECPRCGGPRRDWAPVVHPLSQTEVHAA
jgi:hypothetical protein